MKIKIVLHLLSLVGIILFSGCASSEPQTGCTPKQAWYQAGISAEQTRRDLAACQYESMLNEKSTSVSGATLGQTLVLDAIVSSEQNNRKNQMIQACMTAKGYSLVNSNSSLLATRPISSDSTDWDAKTTSDLIGRWECVSAKGKIGAGLEKVNFDFLPGNRLVTTSIQNGKTYSNKGDYAVEDNKIVMMSPNTAPERCKYSLIGDHLVLTFGHGDGEVILHKNPNFNYSIERLTAEAQFNQGLCYSQGNGVAKDYLEAIKWFTKAIENDPGFADAYFMRGNLKELIGDLDGALDDFNKTIEIKPNLNDIYALRGFVKEYKGDLDGAMADFNKAIELNPKSAPAYCGKGTLNYDLYDNTDALIDLHKSCELGLDVKTLDCIHCYIWLIRARLNEQDVATKELQTYLDNRKGEKSDNFALKSARYLTGQLSESDFFKSAESTDMKTEKEQHCEAYFYAGTKRLIEGDKTIATDYFNKCLATGCNTTDEYHSATAELKSLEKTKLAS